MSIPTHDSRCKTRMYAMKCKSCRSMIHHLTCTCGSSVLFDSIDPFEIHLCNYISDVREARTLSMRLRIKCKDSRKLEKEMRYAERIWRYNKIPLRGPDRISSNSYEVQLLDVHKPGAIDPLTNFFLEGFILDISEEFLPPVGT